MNKNKIEILFLLFVFALNSCSLTKNDILGVYYNKEYRDSYLQFDKNGFYFIQKHPEDLSVYLCCDTMAVGNWTISGPIIELNSYVDYKGSPFNEFYGYLPMNIKEGNNDNVDSTYFYINNPIENNYEAQLGHNLLNYEISFDGTGGKYLITDKFNSNVIKLKKEMLSSFNKFSISIYPTGWFTKRANSIGYVITNEYEIKEKNTNVFHIDVPQLTFNFIAYMRFKGELIKVLNKNEIEWHGFQYIKVR
jgi:hypothetical protein